MVRQSIECMLIQYLLGLLKSRTHLSAGDVAHVVSALKTLAQNLNYGDQVLHILNSDPIWAEFKDQNHDLFLPNAPLRGMITGKFIIKLKKIVFLITFPTLRTRRQSLICRRLPYTRAQQEV